MIIILESENRIDAKAVVTHGTKGGWVTKSPKTGEHLQTVNFLGTVWVRATQGIPQGTWNKPLSLSTSRNKQQA